MNVNDQILEQFSVYTVGSKVSTYTFFTSFRFHESIVKQVVSNC